MALAAAVDKVSSYAFPDMTPTVVKDVTRELLGLAGNDAIIERELSLMSGEQLDVLMKVIYVCLKGDYKNSTTYLKWHGMVYDKAGAGSIIRTISEKSDKKQEAA